MDAEGFSDNSVAMYKGEIYCWINESNDMGDVRTDHKIPIVFNGTEWKLVVIPDQGDLEN